jgi:hypothetical protein
VAAEKGFDLGEKSERHASGAKAQSNFAAFTARLKPCPFKAPKKKLKCRFNKTKERRKGPGLKARVIAFLFQGPEGPCSLREYETASACFIPCESAKPVDD